MRKNLSVIMLLLVVGLVAGCGLINTSSTSQLSIKLTDAPATGIEEVWVTIESVEVSKTDGDNAGKFVLKDFGAEPLKVDLLTLRFDETLLGSEALPVGTYGSIILNVSDTTGDNYVVKGGVPTELKVPSKSLKIQHNFVIGEGEVREIVLDADVRDFISLRGNENNNNGYIINPTAIRVIDRKISSDITGIVLGPDSLPITGVDIAVDIYKSDNTLVTGTLALTEDLKDDTGNLLQPAGSFILKGLLAGEYYVKVTVEGYAVYTSENFTLVAEQNLELPEILLTK